MAIFNPNEKPRQAMNYVSQIKTNQRHHISIKYKDEETLFSAKPAYVEDDMDVKLDDVLNTANLMSQHYQLTKDFVTAQEIDDNKINADESLISSSSMEDSLKIYNVLKGEIVKTPGDSADAEIVRVIDLDNNDNIVTQDKAAEMVDETSGAASEKYVKRSSEIVNVIMENGSDDNILEDLEVDLPKVRDIAKKFAVSEKREEIHPSKSTPKRRKFSNDYELEVVNKSDPKLSGRHNYMHSLTARSLSREFREELRLSMATPIKLPGRANEEDIIRENTRPPSPVPVPGTLKNKLAFFESLKF